MPYSYNSFVQSTGRRISASSLLQSTASGSSTGATSTAVDFRSTSNSYNLNDGSSTYSFVSIVQSWGTTTRTNGTSTTTFTASRSDFTSGSGSFDSNNFVRRLTTSFTSDSNGTTGSGSNSSLSSTSFGTGTVASSTSSAGVTSSSGTLSILSLTMRTTTVSSTTTANLTFSTTVATSSAVTIGSTSGTRRRTTTTSTAFTRTQATVTSGNWTTTTYLTASFTNHSWLSPHPLTATNGDSVHSLSRTATILEASSNEWLWRITYTDAIPAIANLLLAAESFTKTTSLTPFNSTSTRSYTTQATGFGLSITFNASATTGTSFTKTITTIASATVSERVVNPATNYTTTRTMLSRRTTTQSTSFVTFVTRTSASGTAHTTTNHITFTSPIIGTESVLLHDGSMSLVTSTVDIGLPGSGRMVNSMTYETLNLSTHNFGAFGGVTETRVINDDYFLESHTEPGGGLGRGHSFASQFHQHDLLGFKPATNAATSAPRCSNFTHSTSGASTASTANTWPIESSSSFFPQTLSAFVAALGRGTFATAGEVKVETCVVITPAFGSVGSHSGGIPYRTTQKLWMLLGSGAYKVTRRDSTGGTSTAASVIDANTRVMVEMQGNMERWETEACAKIIARRTFTSVSTATFITFSRNKTGASG